MPKLPAFKFRDPHAFSYVDEVNAAVWEFSTTEIPEEGDVIEIPKAFARDSTIAFEVVVLLLMYSREAFDLGVEQGQAHRSAQIKELLDA